VTFSLRLRPVPLLLVQYSSTNTQIISRTLSRLVLVTQIPQNYLSLSLCFTPSTFRGNKKFFGWIKSRLEYFAPIKEREKERNIRRVEMDGCV
jgi:hypothetical protein